jgi:creatine kinase
MFSRLALGGAAAIGAALTLRKKDLEAETSITTVTTTTVTTTTTRTEKIPDADPNYPPLGLSESVRKLPQWIQLGCGNAYYHCPERNAVFPADDCPDEMPDLSKHNNFCANYLRANPQVYHKYKHKKTSTGVPFAICIKTGIDNPGHPMIMTVGLVAGDETCFNEFEDLFEPVTSQRHGGWPKGAIHPTDMNIENVSTTRIDPSCDAEGNCDFVLTSRARTGRSVRGIRLPPACSFEERRELERVVVSGLLKMTGELKGDYFPLHGSRSYAPKPTGMSLEKEEQLRHNGNLFQEPDSTLLLSSGCGRHWPDARGIFHNEAANLFVWLNEEDHMRIVSMEKGDNIKAIFSRFSKATQTVQEVLQSEGYDFMRHDHYGWILTCPSNLGTGLRAGAMIKIPLFSARKDFKDVMKKMRLQGRGTAGVDSASDPAGVWDISNSDRLGKSETALVNIFIEGAAQIIRWEKMLQAGMNIDDLLPK